MILQVGLFTNSRIKMDNDNEDNDDMLSDVETLRYMGLTVYLGRYMVC